MAGALIAALAASAGAAEDYDVNAERDGERVEVRARAAIAATPQLVWRVISDYDRLAEFIPGIKKSTVLERRGNHVQVEQRGEARFLFFSFPIDVRLEVVEWPYEWIASRAVAGTVRRMTGRYEIHPDPLRGGILLRYYGTIEPGFDLPPIVGMAALRGTVEEQFAAMVREIERQAAPAGAQP
jgi:ribosome-associated toxin RatA of RatAB toxin-antitoxin module